MLVLTTGLYTGYIIGGLTQLLALNHGVIQGIIVSLHQFNTSLHQFTPVYVDQHEHGQIMTTWPDIQHGQIYNMAGLKPCQTKYTTGHTLYMPGIPCTYTMFVPPCTHLATHCTLPGLGTKCTVARVQDSAFYSFRSMPSASISKPVYILVLGHQLCLSQSSGTATLTHVQPRPQWSSVKAMLGLRPCLYTTCQVLYYYWPYGHY